MIWAHHTAMCGRKKALGGQSMKAHEEVNHKRSVQAQAPAERRKVAQSIHGKLFAASAFSQASLRREPNPHRRGGRPGNRRQEGDGVADIRATGMALDPRCAG